MASVGLLVSSRRKKVHELRFLDLVVTLAYYEVSWSYFMVTLRFICQHELSDVLEERYSLDKCGYSPCNNGIKVHPTASVSLDIPDKKIYDISRRKKFCSDWCYSAFKFIEDQLPEDPLWKKDREKLDEFKQYPPNAKGCKGEIYFEEDVSDIIDTTFDNSNKSDEIEIKKDLVKKDNIIKKYVMDKVEIKKDAIKKNETKSDVTIIDKAELIDENKKIDRIQNIIKALDNIAIKKKKNLDEVLIKVRENTLNRKDKKLIFLPEVPVTDNQTKFNHEGVTNHLIKVSSSLTEWITKDSQIFLNSNEDEVYFEKNELNENGDATKFQVLPSLDSCNQVVIRRSIILRRIQSCAAPILAEIGLNDNSFHNQLIKFMNTCKLSSQNILFTAKELKCLIIVLVDILFPTISKKVDKDTFLKKYQIPDMKMYNEMLNKIEKVINDVSSSDEDDDQSTPVNFQGDF